MYIETIMIPAMLPHRLNEIDIEWREISLIHMLHENSQEGIGSKRMRRLSTPDVLLHHIQEPAHALDLLEHPKSHPIKLPHKINSPKLLHLSVVYTNLISFLAQ